MATKTARADAPGAVSEHLTLDDRSEPGGVVTQSLFAGYVNEINQADTGDYTQQCTVMGAGRIAIVHQYQGGTEAVPAVAPPMGGEGPRPGQR